MLHQIAIALVGRDRRGRHRRRAERARRRDPARRGRPPGAHPGGRGRARRRRPHRGADAARLPCTTRSRSVYPAAVASPVFGRMPLAEHGLEWVHPDAAYAHPLPDGDAKLLYRDLDAHRGSLGAVDGDSGCEFAQPFLDHFDAVARDDADRLPAARRPGEAARPAPARCGCSTSRACCPGSAVGLGKRLFDDRRLARVALRRRDARRHAAGRRRLRDRRVLPEPARARRRLAVARRAARERLTDALVAYFRASAARSAPARA